jgi:hypothetical protein
MIHGRGSGSVYLGGIGGRHAPCLSASALTRKTSSGRIVAGTAEDLTGSDESTRVLMTTLSARWPILTGGLVERLLAGEYSAWIPFVALGRRSSLSR